MSKRMGADGRSLTSTARACEHGRRYGTALAYRGDDNIVLRNGDVKTSTRYTRGTHATRPPRKPKYVCYEIKHIGNGIYAKFRVKGTRRSKKSS
jgi:hypothetical protein